MSLFSRLYSRRIVNINVNIVLAGLLALIPVAVAVKLVHTHAFDGRGDLTARERLIIKGVTFGTDIVADVLFFYALHWLANHWPRRLPGRELAQVAGDHSAPGYFKDATLVQIERMVLSPLLYTIWLGSQALMMYHHVPPVWATVAGFCLATSCIRTIHTVWMLRTARRLRIAATPPPRVIPDPAGVPGPGLLHADR